MKQTSPDIDELEASSDEELNAKIHRMLKHVLGDELGFTHVNRRKWFAISANHAPVAMGANYVGDLNAAYEVESGMWPTSFRFQCEPSFKLKAWFFTAESDLPGSLDKELWRTEKAQYLEDQENRRKWQKWKRYESTLRALTGNVVRASAREKCTAMLLSQ